MTDLRAIAARGADAMSESLELYRAAGERDLANKLAAVRARWQKVVDKHIADTKAAAVAHAIAETERAQRTILVVNLDGMRTFSEANIHEHHMQRHKRMGDQRPVVAMAMRGNANARGVKPPIPCTVRITRIAPNELDPGGNLETSLKSVQDGIADWIGVNDRRADLVRYECAQEKRGANRYGVRIEVLAEVSP